MQKIIRSTTLPPMLEDAHGLAVSAAQSSDIAAVDDFREALLAMEGGLERVAESAEGAPGCPLLQIYAAIFFLYAGTQEGTSIATQWLDRAQGAMNGSTDRERMLLQAVRLWSQDDNEGAMDLLEEITALHPRDLVAAKICEFNYYITGQHHQGPRFLENMEKVIPHNRDHADALAMYSFALELCGRYEESRAEAERAVSIRFESPWAHHALAHTAIVTSDFRRGRAEQEGFLPTWVNPGLSIHGHNAWHLALFRLEDGDEEGVMELFRDFVWGRARETPGEQVDAISLLWRMELAGYEVDDTIWSEVANCCRPLAYEASFPFVVAQQAHAFSRAGQDDYVDRLRSAADRSAREQPPARRRVWKEAGLPVIDAAIAWGRRDSGKVVELLESAFREIPRVGGSDAQDDVFRLTLVEALSRVGRDDAARTFVSMFPGHRPLAQV
ncbi:MAG: hypothetical protein VX252_15735 [Myxococcota bacterium]|nr:hypothetical protein [Myxococcota bacterium]